MITFLKKYMAIFQFYMNKRTKEVYYDKDYKIKLQLPNQPIINISELFAEVFNGADISHDCKM